MNHDCHAQECTAPNAPRLLFCRFHWRELSVERKADIRATYRRGQEKTKRITGAYYLAQREAVAELAVREGLWDVEKVLDLRTRIWPRAAARCDRAIAQYKAEKEAERRAKLNAKQARAESRLPQDQGQPVYLLEVPAVDAWALVHLGRTPGAWNLMPKRVELIEARAIVAIWSVPADAAALDTAAAELGSSHKAVFSPLTSTWSFTTGLVVHRLQVARLPMERFVAAATASTAPRWKPLAGPTSAWPHRADGVAKLPKGLAAKVRSQLVVGIGRRDLGQLNLLGGAA